jgi:hypothetical protein
MQSIISFVLRGGVQGFFAAYVMTKCSILASFRSLNSVRIKARLIEGDTYLLEAFLIIIVTSFAAIMQSIISFVLRGGVQGFFAAYVTTDFSIRASIRYLKSINNQGAFNCGGHEGAVRKSVPCCFWLSFGLYPWLSFRKLRGSPIAYNASSTCAMNTNILSSVSRCA